MNIGSWNSDSISQLFGGSKGSSNSMSSIYSNLSELNSIKSGSYGKLAKKYYAKEASVSDKKTNKKDKVTKKDTEASSNSKELTRIDDTSKKLVDSASKLYKDTTLYKTDKKDALTSAVSDFVNKYNSAMKEASSSEVDSVASAAASMASTNNINSKLLSKIGIKMDSKTYQLSFDKETFNKANASDVKALFSGSGSYAYQMAVAGSKLKSAAEMEASKTTTYTNSGKYTSGSKTGDIYDSIF